MLTVHINSVVSQRLYQKVLIFGQKSPFMEFSLLISFCFLRMTKNTFTMLFWSSNTCKQLQHIENHQLSQLFTGQFQISSAIQFLPLNSCWDFPRPAKDPGVIWSVNLDTYLPLLSIYFMPRSATFQRPLPTVNFSPLRLFHPLPNRVLDRVYCNCHVFVEWRMNGWIGGCMDGQE